MTHLSVSLYDGPHQIQKFKKLQAETGLSDEQFDLRHRWKKEDGYGINITNRAGSIEMPEYNVKKIDQAFKKKMFLSILSNNDRL